MVAIWILMLAIAIIEVPILIKKGLWGELWAFTGLWIVAGVFASLVSARTVLPSIVLVINKIFNIEF
ncbi:MAG: hypothetical protein GX316_05650 [Firmicutes bacterium]|nr:hypothetical protein [Bacillota bacterium]